MLFVPRQVVLAAVASSSSSSSQPRAAAAAMAKEEPKKEKKNKSKSKAAAKETAATGPRAAVVASVAAFLEAGGFPRTLAALQSEADLEAGAWRSSPVNLQELVAKFLDKSNPAPVAVVVGSDEQGADKATGGVAEDGGKKNKKGKKTGADSGESENKATEPSAHEKPSENAGSEAKEKKQKKKKKDETSAVNVGSDKGTETVKKDDQKPDGKKKKSKKQEKDDVEARLDKAELAIKTKFEAARKLNGDGDKSREEEPKVEDDDADKNNGAVEKKKKKKKDKSASKTSTKTAAGAMPADADADAAKEKRGIVEPVKDDKEKKAKKKRKKSDPEENVQMESKEVAGKDSVPKPEDKNKSGMEIEEGDNGKPSVENAVAGKKRKLGEVEGSGPPVTVKEDNTANQSLTNGFAEDKTNQDSNIKPSKRQKHSSEPKIVNPFQRVKLEEVKFADERLQDNSYWAKGGADTGYGAKARDPWPSQRKGFSA